MGSELAVLAQVSEDDEDDQNVSDDERDGEDDLERQQRRGVAALRRNWQRQRRDRIVAEAMRYVELQLSKEGRHVQLPHGV